jgi:hypothetical protein
VTSPYTAGPATFLATYTGSVSLDALLSGEKWGSAGAGTGAIVTYSFPWTSNSTAIFSGPDGAAYSVADEPNAAVHRGLSAIEQAAAASTLQRWANVANITPVLVAESDTSVGDVRIAWSSAVGDISTGEKAWGWASYPHARYPSGGDVWISTAYVHTDWSPGSYNYMALMHEVGHALGLKHPFEDDVTDKAHANYQYSIMAYDEAPNSLFGAIRHEADGDYYHVSYVVPDTPMLNDIAAIQYLYGANMTYHAGADTYTFDPSTPFLRTIWDAGGNDTISVANFSADCMIDLQQGHYSSIHIPSASTDGYHWDEGTPTNLYDGTNNLAIAFGAVIENATGGSGGDTLIGNSSANHLQGNGGINLLDGGAGVDTAVYSGNFNEYAVATVKGGYTVTWRSSSNQADGLVNIERLSFKDGSMALGMGGMAEDTLQAQYVALAQKFYVAYFGRPADAGGLANMVAQFAAAKVPTTTGAFAQAYSSNAAIKGLIDSFGNSAESATLYHGNNDDFVTAIYAHLLGRVPDQEGLDFWSGALDGGNLARGLAALSIMAGAESNTTTQGLADAVLIANRVTVAGNFTTLLDKPAEVAGYAGDAAAATARAMLDAVNQNTSVLAYESNVFSTVSKMSGGAMGGVAEVTLVGVGTLTHDGILLS